MKNILIFSIFLLYAFTGTAQVDKDWLISMDFAVQEHDKRLYHWPEIPRANLLAMQPENYGTYQLGFSLSKKIINFKKFQFYVGSGLSIELATFWRPFNIKYRVKIGDDILRYTNRYYQNLLQFPIQSKYRILKNWNISLGLLPQFNFLTTAHSNKTAYENYTWWRFDFYSVEVSSGLEYIMGKFNFGLKYRTFQIKKIDPILFYSTSVFVIENEKYETFNPFKLWFSMGYEF